MTYGYVRVSTDKQFTDNQKFEIEKFAKKQKIKVDRWVEETVSGTKDYNKRQFHTIIDNIKENDLIICSELSRLGRNLFMIMEILNICMKKGCKVWTIKDNYRLGDGIESKVLAFAFGLSAEIERNLISQRTKEALAKRRADGVILGRPLGRKSSHRKLSNKKLLLKKMIKSGMTKRAICRELNISRNTLYREIACW